MNRATLPQGPITGSLVRSPMPSNAGPLPETGSPGRPG